MLTSSSYRENSQRFMCDNQFLLVHWTKASLVGSLEHTLYFTGRSEPLTARFNRPGRTYLCKLPAPRHLINGFCLRFGRLKQMMFPFQLIVSLALCVFPPFFFSSRALRSFYLPYFLIIHVPNEMRALNIIQGNSRCDGNEDRIYYMYVTVESYGNL